MLYNPFFTTLHQQANIGGKGYGLVQLAKLGIPIPKTRILGTEGLDLFFQTNNTTFSEVCSMTKEHRDNLFQTDNFPKKLQILLQKQLYQFKDQLAVRSSAIGEDGESQSYAGQYTSVLNISKTDLPQAIMTCWASIFSDRVTYYSENHHKMAVVIQEYVIAQWAGVVYTINPRNGSFSEIIIESFPDVGEKVVSSAVIPDYLVMRRPRPLPFPFRKLGQKIKLHLKSRNDASHSPLPVKHAIRLSQIALRSERKIGSPQDVEWIIDNENTIYFLQTRPISAVSNSNTGTIWTRNFIGERWMVPATHLGWEEIQEQIEYLIAYPETSKRYLGGEQATRLFEGSPYLNATVFRHLLFKPPGREPSPKFLTEMLPPDEVKSLCSQFAKSPDWKVYGSILQTTFEEKRWERFRWNPISNWATWPEFERKLEDFISNHTREIKNIEQAKQRLQACRQMCHEYLKIHIGSVIHGNLFFQGSTWWLREEDLDPHLYLRSAQITSTQRCNWDLWKLARNQRNLDTFLSEYGHRSESSWALFSERWNENPHMVKQLSQTMLHQSDPQIRDCQLLDECKERTSKLPVATRFMIHIAQKYLYLREEQRFHFEKLLWLWKQTWMTLEDITHTPLRFLTKIQAQKVLDGESYLELALDQQRIWKEQCHTWKEKGQPADYLMNNVPIPSNSPVLQGLGISSGIVRGRAVVLKDIGQIEKICRGDILVVSTVDPAWTPLFLKAGGLVSELGGVLSHGAIIAREYQLPAVAAVRGVMRKVSTGDEIIINGDTGAVILLE